MADRRVSIILPEDVYERLARLADAQDREPTQQARLIIRNALASNDSDSNQEKLR